MTRMNIIKANFNIYQFHVFLAKVWANLHNRSLRLGGALSCEAYSSRSDGI